MIHLQLLVSHFNGAKARARPERTSVVVHTLGKGNRPFDGFVYGGMSEEVIPFFLLDRNASLDQHRHLAEIASLFKTRRDLFNFNFRWVVLNLDNLKGATGIYFADPRQLQQYSPHLGNVMVSVKRGRFERFDLHEDTSYKKMDDDSERRHI